MTARRHSSQKAPLGSGARVLFLIDEMEAITAGGTERQLLQLVNIARQNGLKPTVSVLRGTRWLTEEIAGCPVMHFDIGSVRSPRGVVRLVRLARWAGKQHFQILQTFFAESNLLGPWIAKLAGIPIVLGTRRNLTHATHDGSRVAARLQWISNLVVDEILANSEAVARKTAAMERFSKHKIRVVYNGIDLAAFQPDAEARRKMRAHLGLNENEVLIGNVSGLRAIKGVELFVEAAALMGHAAPGAKFVLVGEGEMRPALEAAITRHNLQSRFWLAGAAEDVRPYLAAMDMAVLCSSAEGFSNSLLEYMAAGLPTIATEVGGNREALGSAGVLIPPNNAAALRDAMLMLLDPQRRARLGVKAMARARRFDLQRANQLMGEILRGYAAIAR
jgi:L-malate glycosyltransferase